MLGNGGQGAELTQDSFCLTSFTHSNSQHMKLCFSVCPSDSGVGVFQFRGLLGCQVLQPWAPWARLLPAHSLLGCQKPAIQAEKQNFNFSDSIWEFLAELWLHLQPYSEVVGMVADLSLAAGP